MKVKILQIEVELKSASEAYNAIKSAFLNNLPLQIVTLNPEMVIEATKNPAFARILKNADVAIADGVGIELALKIKRVDIARVRGIDFSYSLLKEAEQTGKKVALIGTKADILEKAISNIKKDLKNLNICYFHDGFFDDDKIIIAELKNASPALVLSALGSPAQEFFNEKIKNEVGACAIGVGGSFDCWAGITSQAPLIWQKMGLEWLYRTIKEPKRLKRIFPTLPLFLVRCIIDSRNRV